MGLSQFVESLPPVPRRIFVACFGATFTVVIFGLIPAWATELNRELGWPRWQSGAGQAIGTILFVACVGLILYCSRLFAHIGKGTPVPIDPPRELVVSGLFRYSRNPIYVGQVGILTSYGVYSGELALFVWAGCWLFFVQAFIVLYEEPALRERFGDSYLEYTHRVPRWVGARAGRDST